MTIKEKLKERKDYIIEEYKKGKSTCELGREFEVSNASIYLFLRDDCYVGMKKVTTLEDVKDDLIKLYNQGVASYSIAKQLNIGKTTVKRYVEQLGLDNGRFSKHRADPLKNHTKEIIDKYNSGIGCHKLSKEYDCHESSILRLLKDNNVGIKWLKEYEINHEYFDQIDSHEKAYVLGFIAGDGNIYKDRLKISICDKDILYDIKNAMRYTGIIQEYEGRKDNHKRIYALAIYSKQIAEKLNNLGCPPNKTFTCTIPDIEDKYFNSYCLGLFDADGTINKTKMNGKDVYNIGFSGSKSLIPDLVKRIEKLTKVKLNMYIHGNILVAKTAAKQKFKDLGEWLYKDSSICLERKHSKYQDFLQNYNSGV